MVLVVDGTVVVVLVVVVAGTVVVVDGMVVVVTIVVLVVDGTVVVLVVVVVGTVVVVVVGDGVVHVVWPFKVNWHWSVNSLLQTSAMNEVPQHLTLRLLSLAKVVTSNVVRSWNSELHWLHSPSGSHSRLTGPDPSA